MTKQEKQEFASKAAAEAVAQVRESNASRASDSSHQVTEDQYRRAEREVAERLMRA